MLIMFVLWVFVMSFIMFALFLMFALPISFQK